MKWNIVIIVSILLILFFTILLLSFNNGQIIPSDTISISDSVQVIIKRGN